ncbi:hypothetical protein BU16DRAFT_540045 [Lophium mytilinum]|uniref:Uncharacterized protein n=1 Tax=Lophium mytilinum TaxID=390894 RepID=A0A6A6QV48_9PEZI|nr:hypothetical protein BU16DRAFT_540045 [Lophium mytilinum]
MCYCDRSSSSAPPSSQRHKSRRASGSGHHSHSQRERGGKRRHSHPAGQARPSGSRNPNKSKDAGPTGGVPSWQPRPGELGNARPAQRPPKPSKGRIPVPNEFRPHGQNARGQGRESKPVARPTRSPSPAALTVIADINMGNNFHNSRSENTRTGLSEARAAIPLRNLTPEIAPSEVF